MNPVSLKKPDAKSQAEANTHHPTEHIAENLVTKNHLELMKKDLIIKLGGIIVGSVVGTTVVILGLLPMMLR